MRYLKNKYVATVSVPSIKENTANILGMTLHLLISTKKFRLQYKFLLFKIHIKVYIYKITCINFRD